MSKLEKRFRIQEEIEGPSEHLAKVKLIHEALLDINEGSVWNSQWNVLVNTYFFTPDGKPSLESLRFYKPTKLGEKFIIGCDYKPQALQEQE